jgi:hypothetical protein
VIRLSDPGARALLVGVGRHEPGSRLPDVPAVAATVADLGRCLVERCGLPQAALHAVVDPADPLVVDRAVREVAGQATSVLLVCYIGHGLLDEDGGAAPGHRRHGGLGRGAAAHYQALPYRTVRDALSDSRAQTVAVVLDCCFAGRAAASLVAGADDVFAMGAVRDSYLLTAAAREEHALAVPGQPRTAFTGAVDRRALPRRSSGPAAADAGEHLPKAGAGVAGGGPARTAAHANGRAGDVVLADNPAYQPPRPRRGDTPGGEAAAEVCPYRGLESYGPDDARWFFGRTELTAALAARLAEQAAGQAGLLMVIGASGAGKSSLLRAGLLPALRAGGLGLPGSAEWPMRVITPGADPLGALATPFAGPARAPAAVRAHLAADPAALAGLVADALTASAGDGGAEAAPRLVMVVDQFEELFDPEVAQADRRAFVAALAAAGAGADGPGALVVIGMRADFFGRAAGHPELQPALSSPVVVGPMTGEQARQVIDGPAREAGLDLEAGLAERRSQADSTVLVPPLSPTDTPSDLNRDARRLPDWTHVR